MKESALTFLCLERSVWDNDETRSVGEIKDEKEFVFSLPRQAESAWRDALGARLDEASLRASALLCRRLAEEWEFLEKYIDAFDPGGSLIVRGAAKSTAAGWRPDEI